jgi:transposase
MKRFIEGEDRSQSTLFPERLDDYIAEDNAVRVVDAFVDSLDLKQLGFDRVEPSVSGGANDIATTVHKTPARTTR